MEERVKQLNSSECTPFAFRVYATYEVNSRLLDKKIHSIIDKLNPQLRSVDEYNGQKRVREFYAMSAEDAYSKALKEFTEKHCPRCPSYLFCGGEIILACKAFNKFLNEKV